MWYSTTGTIIDEFAPQGQSNGREDIAAVVASRKTPICMHYIKGLREILLGLDWAAIIQKTGEVPEWLKGLVLKTSRRSRVSWVRIPPSPPTIPYRQPIYLTYSLKHVVEHRV